MLLRNKQKNTKSKEKNTKQNKPSKKELEIKRTVQNAIPYEKMYRSGLCAVKDNLFSQSIKFTDINYQIASEDDQITIFGKYMEILNSLGSSDGVQLTVQNRIIDQEEFKANTLIHSQQDGFNIYRKEVNDALLSNIKEGNNAVISEKMITFASQEEDYEEAMKSLKHMAHEYETRFKQLGSHCTIMTGEERLETIASIFNPQEKLMFSYDNMDGLTTKDAIAPSSLNFKPKSYFRIGTRFAKIIFLKNYSTELSDKLISDISKIEANLTMTFHMNVLDNHEAISLVKSQIAKMEMQKITEQRRALKNGYDPDMIPQELRYSLDEGEKLLEDVQQRNQRLFSCQFLVMMNAETKDELNELEKKIKNVARKHTTEMGDLDYLQEKALGAVLPLANTTLPIARTLTTSVCASFMPFTSQELMHTGEAFYYGVNAVSHNLILCNRARLMNPSGWILGKPGAGKSFAAKREMINVILASKNSDVIVIDPEREYTRIAELFNGETIYVDNKHDNYVNPLEQDLESGSDVISSKADFLQAMCSQIMGSLQMTPQIKSIIDRCARLMYERYRDELEEYKNSLLEAQKKPNASMNIQKVRKPSLAYFFEILREQEDDEVKNLITALELYVNGSNDLFAKESNVNIDNRFTVYDMNELSSSLKPLAMLVILESLWDKIIANFKRGKRTYIYIDEIYLLFMDKYCTEFMQVLWKRARKYNAVLTGITQNVEDLLVNNVVRSMLSNSEFIIMLSQAPADKEELAGLLNISDEQLSYISHSDEGTGLLFNGKVIVPFKDNFPKNTKLYQAMTTKPEERKQIDGYA